MNYKMSWILVYSCFDSVLTDSYLCKDRIEPRLELALHINPAHGGIYTYTLHAQGENPI